MSQLADQIIDDVARDKRMESAVRELIATVINGAHVGISSVTNKHSFTCAVDGQTYDVTISLEVAGQRKAKKP